MPSRNIVKDNVADSYYHVYACGVNKQSIFIDEEDYWYFLSLMDRYLSPNLSRNPWVRKYEKLYDSVEVLAYCLNNNHLQLMIYQLKKGGMSRLIHDVMSTYSRYFNKRHGRTGPLLEGRYRASRISSEEHILYISRHIHSDSVDWLDYPHSSLRAYLYDDAPAWLDKARLAEMFGSAAEYLEYLKKTHIETADMVSELADSPV